MHRIWHVALALFLLARAAAAQPLVATTDPLTPAEQQKLFKLPPGFEIELVACEPDVHKPMNMKFDPHGRLWVTHSLEYPFPAKDDASARDAITIFSEFGPDGRAKKIHRFAEHLNIPIGVLPLSDREAISWSIPHLFRLTDSDGDGVADQRSPLFGPFGIIDTHGNQNALTRWVDGWVYANHGFNNQSHVKAGASGDVLLTMHSGNTYRFRADGSAIEQFSWGQVNPFGLSFDPNGNLYSADCHSRAVTMLLREGYYQSFGKPHDGLGFAPDTTDTDHGGTGLAGVSYYAAQTFPEAFRNVLFVGNVITNRVHCDRLQWTGSSPKVAKVEDFLTCDDPWFRPVDLQLGPDGALYVADFYNRIIGHYEVPLTHPGRDRERGRIWRVVYKPALVRQTAVQAPAANVPDQTTASKEQLVELLGHPNLTVRMMATNVLIDRFAADAPGLARAVLAAASKPATQSFDPAAQQAHALWVLKRTAAIDEPLARRLADGSTPLVRLHLVQALGETQPWQAWQLAVVLARLADADPFVQRAAATALALHPAVENIVPLLRLQHDADPGDVQLAHAVKIAVRDQLRSPAVGEKLASLKLTDAERKQLIEVAALSPAGPAGIFIYEEALHGNVAADLLAKALPSAAKSIDPDRIDTLLEFVAKTYLDNHEFQIELLRGVNEGLSQRGRRPSERMLQMLAALLEPAIVGDKSSQWVNLPVADAPPSPSPWGVDNRAYLNDSSKTPLITSLRDRSPANERLTGILRSPPFTLPAKLTFWMCGHDGQPPAPVANRNYTRLVLEDGTEVARSAPPRNDIAHRFEWDLTAHAGQRGHIEVVDGLSTGGYAWLAVSRFEPEVVRVPANSIGDNVTQRVAAMRLAADTRLEKLADVIVQAAAETDADPAVRFAAGEALVTLRPQAAIGPLTGLVADANLPLPIRQQAADLLGRIDRDEARAALLGQLRSAPQPLAVSIATGLAGRKETAAELLAEIRAGHASPTLLREPTVLDRLKAAQPADLDKQISELTAKLSPADDRIAELTKQRKAAFVAGKFDPEAGRAVFARSVCKNCHRVGEVGGVIGPALDGIGNRGLDRVLEDVLDPNRNVDQAFRVTLIETDGGRVLSGFGVREEGESLVLFDSNGQQIRLPLAEVAERSHSNLSPMPANISEVMSEQEFYQLLAFLLSQRAK